MKRYFLFTLMLLLGCTLFAQPDKVYKSLKDVKNPADVYILQLHNKRLKTIPREVFTMTNLRQLDLRGNRIAFLPDSISQLQNLQRLELSRNPLMALPASMANMEQLRELVLWSTYVTELPPQFARLDGTLELLDLRHCPLMLDDQTAINNLLPSVKKLWDYACNCAD